VSTSPAVVPPLVVRPAAPGDVAALAAVQVAARRAARLPGPAAAPGDATVAAYRAAWSVAVADAVLAAASAPGAPELVTLVAAPPDDPGVLGVVVAGPGRDADADRVTAELDCLYVHPGSWRRGVGRALHDAALAALLAAGYRTVVAWPLRVNDVARLALAAAGWAPDGAARTGTYRDGAPRDVLRYRRALVV
jgi:RimJ/RimL family protein N-acetyltransferase